MGSDQLGAQILAQHDTTRMPVSRPLQLKGRPETQLVCLLGPKLAEAMGPESNPLVYIVASRLPDRADFFSQRNDLVSWIQ